MSIDKASTNTENKKTTKIRRKSPSKALKQRSHSIFSLLTELYPDATCSLNYETPLELLVATILSAQCTDKRVNKVTPALFATFPDAIAIANGDRDRLEALIRSTGFYRHKAKNIQGACQMIVSDFDGKVPSDMEQLLKLPGVARKTANVVSAHAFSNIQGVTVDTHVKRLSNRWELTKSDKPIQIEKDLMALLPQSEWENYSIRTIYHGRAVCKARKPVCEVCKLAHLCPSAKEYLN
ncbi:endonuclease III [Pleurocapsa sp. FMAR1]|uniref:endonuclease III n=1 Tax=Pleurocapsa sp. FMAR1 TaxID=3040204 RepID=UPI0029C62CDC|nr:endonuclease III [Pleurocapsa sp. FMAR1]